MENTVIKDVVLDKKFDGYGTNYNNFVAQSEITVTITLNEYREKYATCQPLFLKSLYYLVLCFVFK